MADPTLGMDDWPSFSVASHRQPSKVMGPEPGFRIDFARRSADYAKYRPGYPDGFYRRLDALRPLQECRTLDLATGPGTMAFELAARGAIVVGVVVEHRLWCVTARKPAEQDYRPDPVLPEP